MSEQNNQTEDDYKYKSAQDALTQTDEESGESVTPVSSRKAKGRFRDFISFFGYMAITLGVVFAFLIGNSVTLPNHLNPFTPFDFRDAEGPFTQLKFQRALLTEDACKAALRTSETVFIDEAPRLSENPNCHIRERVVTSEIAGVRLNALDTRCDTALRMTAWVEFEVKPLAREMLGRELSGVDHVGSYNCRTMRTSSGNSSRMSKHATAEAVDVSGFRFEDGSSLTLVRDWNGAHGDFLKAVHDASCDYFPLVLGPEYNALHRDHFHLEEGGWRACR